VTDAPAFVDEIFDASERFGTTYAALIVQGDNTLAERYGNALPNGEAVGPETKLLSWSIAKSVLHATVGVLVDEGRLDPDAPACVPEWSAPGDPRRAITLEHLLCMRDGLAFVEDYLDERISDVIEMLFGAGNDDVGHFAADRALAHEPGSTFNYSSGSSNIVARVVGEEVGRGEPMARFLRERVFGPIGMPSAEPRFDPTGTFIGSSYVYATARDWVRFGQCYLRGGVGTAGARVVSERWVAHGRRARSIDPDDNRPYGAHWWVLDGASREVFYASGYEGQRVLVCPDLDLVVARFGRSTSDQYDALTDWCRRLITALDSLPSASPAS
jgi:CubicO group peptidase (beta-lactamase class C family)